MDTCLYERDSISVLEFLKGQNLLGIQLGKDWGGRTSSPISNYTYNVLLI